MIVVMRVPELALHELVAGETNMGVRSPT